MNNDDERDTAEEAYNRDLLHNPDSAPHDWCAECGRAIEQTEDGRWIDAHTAPAASLVYCYSDADVIETDAPSDTRHSPS